MFAFSDENYSKMFVFSSINAELSLSPFSLSVFWNAVFDFVLQDIKAASLRTLTSIVHLERTPKLSNIIDCTGTASYHGFLPVLVRNCIQAMIGENVAETFWLTVKCDVHENGTIKMKACLIIFDLYFLDPLMEPYPHQFATALFSFLYHLASYDAGGEALVSCGMMEALLKVYVLTNNIFLFKPFLVNLLSESPLLTKYMYKYMECDSSFKIVFWL